MGFLQGLFGKIADAKLDGLVLAPRNSTPAGRSSSVVKLAGLGPSAVGPLLRYLGHPEKSVRLVAAQALGDLGGLEAIGPLEKLLSDLDADVKAGRGAPAP